MERQEVIDTAYKLSNECHALSEVLLMESNNSSDAGRGAIIDNINDRTRLLMFHERLRCLSNMLFNERLFAGLAYDIEDEKSLFLVQKTIKRFLDEELMPYIEEIITSLKQLHFYNYRTIDLSREIKSKLIEIRDFYAERYK